MDTSPVTTSKLDVKEIDWLIEMMTEVKSQASEATRELIKESLIRRNPLLRIALSLDEAMKKADPEQKQEKDEKDVHFEKIVKDLDGAVEQIYKDAQESLEHSTRLLLKLTLAKSEV